MKWALPIVIVIGLMIGLLIPGPDAPDASNATVAATSTAKAAPEPAPDAAPAPDPAPAPDVAPDPGEVVTPPPPTTLRSDIPEYMPAPVRAGGGVPPTIS
jgi:outer membrane biosynthesis protein TonB